jgi:hypothetical protein
VGRNNPGKFSAIWWRLGIVRIWVLVMDYVGCFVCSGLGLLALPRYIWQFRGDWGCTHVADGVSAPAKVWIVAFFFVFLQCMLVFGPVQAFYFSDRLIPE